MNLHYSPLEGNRLIAEFLGWHLNPKRLLKYHSSWDWLMPVVEKIEKMGYDSRIHGNNSDGGFLCDFVDDENAEWGLAVTHSTKIEAVWLAVIDFIKFYKSQTQQS